MASQEDFIIPEKFIKQLEEFSNGGFILLTFSSAGRPVVHKYYETEKDRLALESALEIHAQRVAEARFEMDSDDEAETESEEE